MFSETEISAEPVYENRTSRDLCNSFPVKSTLYHPVVIARYLA